MKRQILTIAAVLTLVFAGAVLAQSPQNTTAPGPTTQQEPGQTNNNLPNPGNPQTQVGPQNPVVQEQGTVEGTATESMTGQQGANTTGQLQQETEPTTGAVDVDVDTGERAEGAVDVDVTTTPDADTDASGSGVQTTTTTDTLDDDAALPATASDLPTVALMGLLALGAAFVLRLARRNA